MPSPNPAPDIPPPPTREQILDLLRSCKLPASAAAVTTAHQTLLALTEELARERGLPEAVRSKQRRQRLTAQKSVTAAFRDLPAALQARHPQAVQLSPMLERRLADHLNAGDFENLIDTLQKGGSIAADQGLRAVTGRRRRVTPSQAGKMLPAIVQTLLPYMENILRHEQLHPGGRPVNRLRHAALTRLLELYEALTGRPARAQPSTKYLDFCSLAFPLLGLDDTGLEEAAERLFQQRHQRR